MVHITRLGAWMSVLPSTFNGIELGSQEWRDFLFLCYIIIKPELPDRCNGCGASFSILSSLNCKKGGLITLHQNEICDGFTYFVSKAFTTTHVHGYPKI